MSGERPFWREAVAHGVHEPAICRSADCFVREFRDFSSCGHGGPHSNHRVLKSFSESIAQCSNGPDGDEFHRVADRSPEEAPRTEPVSPRWGFVPDGEESVSPGAMRWDKGRFGWKYIGLARAMSVAMVCVLVFKIVTRGAEPGGRIEETSSILTNRSYLHATNISFPKVYGASRWEQPIAQAPSSVSIVTRDEISKYGYRTLADVLRSLSGFHVSYDRMHPSLGTRGFNRADYNNRVLVLVDGHRVNNNLSDGGFIGSEFILDTDLIDRVEVIRGPGSVLYGNNAFFGVINVVTRLGGDFASDGVEVSGETASYDSYKGRVSYGRLFSNGVELLLSGSVYQSQGQESLFYQAFNTSKQNLGIAQGMDEDKSASFLGTLT